MKTFGLVLFLIGIHSSSALRAQDNNQLTTSSEPGAVLAAVEAGCRKEFEAQRLRGISDKFCPVQHFLVLAKEDMCGLPLALRQGTPEEWDQFLSDCLPRLVFGNAKFTVEDHVFKRKILEDAGEVYTPDHEAVNVNYTVEFCTGQNAYVSAMTYIGSTKGSVFLMTEYPPECTEPIEGQ